MNGVVFVIIIGSLNKKFDCVVSKNILQVLDHEKLSGNCAQKTSAKIEHNIEELSES